MKILMSVHGFKVEDFHEAPRKILLGTAVVATCLNEFFPIFRNA